MVNMIFGFLLIAIAMIITGMIIVDVKDKSVGKQLAVMLLIWIPYIAIAAFSIVCCFIGTGELVIGISLLISAAIGFAYSKK